MASGSSGSGPIPHLPENPCLLSSGSEPTVNDAFNAMEISTRSGYMWQIQDLSLLTKCTCSEAVMPVEIKVGKAVLKCKEAGCKMQWISLQNLHRKEKFLPIDNVVPPTMCQPQISNKGLVL